jgi:signal transduction histidine kinase/ligand-binding sensor domain-containing protein
MRYWGFVHRRDGSLWAAGDEGVWRLERGVDGRVRVAERYTHADGLPEHIQTLVEDANGNLWGTTAGFGIFRIAEAGFVAYESHDGVGNPRASAVSAIFEDQSGRLCTGTNGNGIAILVKQGGRFQSIPLRYPRSQTYFGWGWNQVMAPAHDGEWWWAGGQMLLRFPKLAHAEDMARTEPIGYDVKSTLGCSQVFRVMEDSSGDIWIACQAPYNFLTRWERKTGRFHRWTASEGASDRLATVIREGPNGHFWIGTFANDVVRFRNGHFDVFPLTPGPINGIVRDLLIDHSGRVWVSTWRSGVFRCDNPEDPNPVFHRYTVEEGLSSDVTYSLVEDRAGFVYVGTTIGVDRIDPQAPIGSRRIRHFTTADGLPTGDQGVAFRDSRGHLWFGGLHGLAEFDPAKDTPKPPSQIYVTRVRVRGEDIPLPWEGSHALSLNLGPNRNQMEIEYAGVGLRASNSLRYQYRLGGVDSQWSDEVEQLSINFASLPRGASRFEVRAVNADGQVGLQPAAIDLYVQFPLWLRWWFLTGAAGLFAGFAALLYNYRVRQLLAMERLRMRIATDLHDDVGASLSQISILSELARNGSTPQVLTDIAEIARGMVGEMSDIVWAINPRHDRLAGLVHRMRRFAEDTLGGRNIELNFEASRLTGESAVPLEIRRPLYLVFKEAVNNVARHSGAAKASIQLEQSHDTLQLRIEDDGCGFEPDKLYEGEGLASIARRMREVGGMAEWDSRPGIGTRFTAVLPLRAGSTLHELGGRLRRKSR